MTFNPNEQRDKAGKWTAGGDTVGAITDPDGGWGAVRADQAAQRAEEARRIGLAAKTVAEKLNYNPADITVTLEDKTFMLNGASYHYAGSCDLNTGKITLYQPTVMPGEIAGVTAHEIGHAKFEDFFKDYQTERDAVFKESATIMKADGTLKPPFDEKYPTYQRYEQLFEGNLSRLATEDGVSDYSRKWWDAVKDGKALSKLGIHETLAEMSRLEYQTGKVEAPPTLKPDGFLTSTPSPLWTEIYQTVKDHWQKKYGK